ncbi:MAG: cupin domain-containing protein [Mariprofundus sp.]|nr:cupin domain-containing protein [Mariprofundus sp.]
MKINNIFGNISQDLPQEITQTLLACEGARMERIVSHGHASPENFWYDQDESEWVLLVAGAARLEIDSDGMCNMRAGDYLLIPTHRKHRVDWTDPETDTIWLALFFKE